MIVLPRSLVAAGYPIKTRNDTRTAIAAAYGLGSQTAFQNTVSILQISAGKAAGKGPP
ncbi:hypothetical protein [Bradyrhizobium sp. AUGA SZCCT0431]|uniref:hypothetical protein n=1 Tax=Bradyrhizobium sp. AUGA SZCCT0431 TaxID=2807674 RepID=UPI001BA62D72|nr:hypothetical protein [Bradyrhizobium sp. AUGA SZCCT0431]MBR1144249.1 hypothetical protein [Bradyrhizobium sp. AUGA SZCCT0431]